MWWFATSAWAADLLFVGNSYLYAHDLELLTRAALAQDGDEGLTVRLADPGLRWVDHVNRAQTAGSEWERALLDPASSWTVGILQEQSQIPGFVEGDPALTASREAADTLDGWLDARGADTVLLMTWGRRDGDPDWPELYPDFATMQARLAAGTEATAATLSTADRPVRVAPAGLAFAALHTSDPAVFVQLYAADGSHPSFAGEWLAAMVVYATLTGRDPTVLQPPVGVSAELAVTLAAAARDVTSEAATTTAGSTAETAETGTATAAPTKATGCGCRKAPVANVGALALMVAMRRRLRW